jgi:hypothetical protein
MVSHKHRRNRKKRGRRTRRKRHVQRGGAQKSAIVFIITNRAGFASVFNCLCRVYIYAKKTGQDFFIEHGDDWSYNYKDGWHDYFKTLKMYDPNAGYGDVQKYSHVQTGNIPQYTAGEYTACVKEVLVLKDELEKRVQDYIDKIAGPYKAVYVRRGDKTEGLQKEMEPMAAAELLKISDISKDDKLFIKTDDYRVVEEMKAHLPAENIFTLTPQSSKGAVAKDIFAQSPEKRRDHAEELFMSFFILVRATRAWTDNRSNLGRLHKLYSPDTVVVYPREGKAEKLTSETEIDPVWKALPYL